MNREQIEEARGEWDEDGFYLYLVTDEGERLFRLTDTTVARELLRAVAPLLGWVADEDRERAAYDRASPEEREAVIRPAHLDCGVSRDRIEDMRVRADEQRKRERENPS